MEDRISFNIRAENKLVFYSFIFLLLSDLTEYLSGPTRLNFSSTYVCAFLKIFSIYYILKFGSQTPWKKAMPNPAYRIFTFFVFWNLMTFVHGLISSNDYWDFKFLILTNSFCFLIPYAVIIGLNFSKTVLLIRFVLKKLYLYGFVLVPLSTISFGVALYARMMFSVGLFLLFSVYMKKKWLYLILLVGIFSILTGSDLRANMIRIIIGIILVIAFYYRSLLSKGLIKFICLLFFLAPFVFLLLGVTDVFNLFKIMEDDPDAVVVSDKPNSELGIDTRTLLYAEVLKSMDNNDSFIFGEGGAGTYQSAIFDYLGDGRGRYGVEVGFLNTLLYSGVIGVLAYLLVLLMACYYAINYSNNFLCKMLALFLASRWMIFFLEDITKYDMNFYFLWMAVGLCFSFEFRKLKDGEIRQFFLSILPNSTKNRLAD